MAGIVLSDSGRDLNDGPEGPWFQRDCHLDPKLDLKQRVFLPTLLFDSTDFTAKPHGPLLPTHGPVSKPTQSVSDIHGTFMMHSLDRNISAASPFYALHNLYKFAAASESQFLNMLQVQLDVEYTFFNDEPNMQQSLANLKYQKEILNDHIQQLEATVMNIGNRGSATWPCCTDPDQSKIADRAAEILLKDYTDLLKRAKRLSRECAEGMDDVRNAALLAESKKGIQQARGLGRLTMLASIFVPLSFTTSFFGMNFQEFGGGTTFPTLNLWVWFVVSAPLFMTVLLFCFWDDVKKLARSCYRTKWDRT
jgi:hypothetical protein